MIFREWNQGFSGTGQASTASATTWVPFDGGRTPRSKSAPVTGGTALRRHGPERRELELGYGLPSYVASTLSSAAPLYDVVYCDFDSEPVEAALRSLGVQVARSVYDMPGVANDTSVIIEYFARRTGLRR